MADTSDAEVGVGEAAVRLARRELEATVLGEPTPTARSTPPGLREARGVFVTLKTHPDGRLRGCIGFPLPSYPLYRAIGKAAAAAATEDPRFPPVRPGELGRLTVEVSVLSLPEPVLGSPEERVAQVSVGRDGLIVEADGDYGLLLPQVGPEQGWDARALLEGTCEKAGVDPHAWRRSGTRVHRFTAEIYRERSPGGPVDRAGEPVRSA